MIRLACTVRGCGALLERGERTWTCPSGHAFDVARAGHVNLLQPNDRRSLDAGDSKESVNARRALFDAGCGSELRARLSDVVAAWVRESRGGSVDRDERARPVLVDLGCGEGTYAASLATSHDLDAVGVDLSAHAIEAAARRHPRFTWVVANADRTLPFPDASVDLVTSIDGRRVVDETWRVLRPGGAWIVAVSGSDDLRELREGVLGEARDTDRAASVVHDASGRFELVERVAAVERRRVGAPELAWIAASTYRCARTRERSRLTELGARGELDVTFAHDVLRFRRLDGPSRA